MSKSIADIKVEHKKKRIEIHPRVSFAVRDLVNSMLQLDPAKRANIDQILSSVLFDKYKKPPFHFPLSPSQYQYMLGCYLLNTQGASDLHLPQEISRLQSIHRDSITSGRNAPEKTILEEASTKYTSTYCSDTQGQNLAFDNNPSLHESLSDLLFDPGHEECTLSDFQMDPTKLGTDFQVPAMRDSLTAAISEMDGRDFGLGLNAGIFNYEASIGYPEGEMTCPGSPVDPPSLKPELASFGLNPRIISIKRKQSDGHSGL